MGTLKQNQHAYSFARGEGSSFNITNVIEDTFEAIFGFVLRYVYTTGAVILTPRRLLLHILTHNRQLRITRPYSYFLFSFLILLVGLTLALAYGSEIAEPLEKLFGRNFSVTSFIRDPTIERLFLSLGPTLIIVLICVWITAVLTTLAVVSLRRFPRLLAPIYFGLVYFVALAYLSIAMATGIEAIVYNAFAYRLNLSVLVGPGANILSFLIFVGLSILTGVALARLLFAFSRIGLPRRARKFSRIMRTFVAWVIATAGLYTAVVLAGAVPEAINTVSARLDSGTLGTAELRLSCYSAEKEERAFSGGNGPPPELVEINGHRILPFLNREFEFLLVNQSESDIDIVGPVEFFGTTASCRDTKNQRSCWTNDGRLLGAGRVIEPETTGGAIVVAPGSSVGLKVMVTRWEPNGRGAYLLSAPSIALESHRFRALQNNPEHRCDPFRNDRKKFDRSFCNEPACRSRADG